MNSKWYNDRVNGDLAAALADIDGKICAFQIKGATIPCGQVYVERVDIGKDSLAPSKALDDPGFVRVSGLTILKNKNKKKSIDKGIEMDLLDSIVTQEK